MDDPLVASLASMGRQVDLDDRDAITEWLRANVTDAAGVAEILGLSSRTGRNTVRGYRHRYPDFPGPIVDLGQGRCLLFLRSEIKEWRRRHPGRQRR